MAVSAVALIGLLAVTGCKTDAGTAGNAKSVDGKGIAFVELDSVIANFDMAKDMTINWRRKQKNSEAELTAKSQAFDRDVRDYQNKAQKGLITRATAAEMEQTLAQQQQSLLALRDEMAL